MQMSKPIDYAVRLLEVDSPLRGTLERILPLTALQDDSESKRLIIGLFSWSSETTREIAGVARLRKHHDGPLVAVLSELPTVRGARAVVAQLDGSVLIGELSRTLLPTLDAVAVGQCVVPRAVRQVVDRPALSPRERQILAMIVLNFSNAEIARKLFVTESNVKNHLSSAFQKLGVKSRSAAAELILDRESGLGPGILRISPDEALPGNAQSESS
jgi:DNA-binding NarL/FixJ family response regulator